jgi:copper chaperone CopZ
MSVRTLSVSGLRCAHCVQLLERNLRRVPGVRRVEIRPVREEVEIDADPRFVTATILESAVRDSGLYVQTGRRPLFDLEEPGGEAEPGETVAAEGAQPSEADLGDLDLGGFDLGDLDFGDPDRGGG